MSCSHCGLAPLSVWHLSIGRPSSGHATAVPAAAHADSGSMLDMAVSATKRVIPHHIVPVNLTLLCHVPPSWAWLPPSGSAEPIVLHGREPCAATACSLVRKRPEPACKLVCRMPLIADQTRSALGSLRHQRLPGSRRHTPPLLQRCRGLPRQASARRGCGGPGVRRAGGPAGCPRAGR